MARAVGADTAAGVATCRAVPVRTCEAGVQACRQDVAVQTLTLTLTLARRPRAEGIGAGSAESSEGGRVGAYTIWERWWAKGSREMVRR